MAYHGPVSKSPTNLGVASRHRSLHYRVRKCMKIQWANSNRQQVLPLDLGWRRRSNPILQELPPRYRSQVSHATNVVGSRKDSETTWVSWDFSRGNLSRLISPRIFRYLKWRYWTFARLFWGAGFPKHKPYIQLIYIYIFIYMGE